MKIPVRYLPLKLTKKDKKKYKKELEKSKKMYKNKKYYTRKKVKSFTSKESQHIKNAKNIYNIKSVKINDELAKKTGCSKKSLKKIVNKGKGAYFSSGSRPNQNATSWGLARLASAITGSKAAVVDKNILINGCDKKSKALKLMNKAIIKYGQTVRKTPKITINNG